MTPEPRTDVEALLANAHWMHALAFRLLGDPAAADDVVQDATVAALLHAPADGTRLEPWLSRVVRNFSFRHRRGARRRAEREAQTMPPAQAPSPAETVERLDLQRTLVDAVLAIEEPLRTTLVLRYFENQTSAEIARRQGVPAGTVRWRLKRGLDALRERLDARAGSRDTWVALLTPYAARPLALSTGGAAAATGSKLLIGVLAMKTAQLVAAALVLSIGGVTWWSVRGGDEQAGASAAAASPSVAAPAPVDMKRAAAAELETPAAADTARASVVAEPPPAVEQPPEAPPEARLASVDARFVDEHGAPWSGVRLAPRAARWFPQWDPGAGVLSGADGRAALHLELPPKRARGSASGELQLELVASRAGCGTLRRSVTVSSGETVHLGDIVLGPGVRILGRALDENGSGVAGATIGVSEAALAGDEGRMRRHGSDSFREAPGASSAADGTFALEGVAPGALRIWAHAEGKRYAWSAPLEVPRDRDVLGFEIVLTPLLATDRIAGEIVGPNDAPIAHADLWFEQQSSAGITATSTPVDAQGRFALLVEHDDSSYDFTARDKDERFASTTIEGVRPGTLDLVIRMRDKRFLALRVHDAQGLPIEGARCELTAHGLGTDEQATSTTPGEYAIVLPDGAFHLGIAARGYRSRTLGPLDPGALSGVLDILLERAPVVRGRVTAGGVPVPGARVHLLGDDADAGWTVSGYRCRYVVMRSSPETSCDAEGRFELDCDEDHGFWLRATAEGWAPGEAGPLDAAQLGADSEFDLELTTGGALEGHVLLSDGGDGEGVVVALNHGDGAPRTLRAGPGGFFHVDGLAPGKWQVLAAESEIDPGSTTYSSSSSDAPMEWSCEVLAGRTTRHDLVLSKP